MVWHWLRPESWGYCRDLRLWGLDAGAVGRVGRGGGRTGRGPGGFLIDIPRVLALHFRFTTSTTT